MTGNKTSHRHFPVSPVVKTPHLACRGRVFQVPGQGTEILYACLNKNKKPSHNTGDEDCYSWTLGGGVTVTTLRTRGDTERFLRAVGQWHWGGELNLQAPGKTRAEVTRYMSAAVSLSPSLGVCAHPGLPETAHRPDQLCQVLQSENSPPRLCSFDSRT